MFTTNAHLGDFRQAGKGAQERFLGCAWNDGLGVRSTAEAVPRQTGKSAAVLLRCWGNANSIGMMISFFAPDEQCGAEGRMQRAEDGAFERAECAQGAVDEWRRDGWIGRAQAEGFFDDALGKFYGEGPLKPVGGDFDFEAGLLKQRKERGFAVAGDVVVDDVVIGPDEVEGGDSDDESAAGLEERDATAKCDRGIGDVFEDIEEQEKRILFAGLEGIVERADMNFLEMRIGGIDDVAVGFDAFDIAEFGERVEEERVAAANVEDGDLRG